MAENNFCLSEDVANQKWCHQLKLECFAAISTEPTVWWKVRLSQQKCDLVYLIIPALLQYTLSDHFLWYETLNLALFLTNGTIKRWFGAKQSLLKSMHFLFEEFHNVGYSFSRWWWWMQSTYGSRDRYRSSNIDFQVLSISLFWSYSPMLQEYRKICWSAYWLLFGEILMELIPSHSGRSGSHAPSRGNAVSDKCENDIFICYRFGTINSKRDR